MIDGSTRQPVGKIRFDGTIFWIIGIGWEGFFAAGRPYHYGRIIRALWQHNEARKVMKRISPQAELIDCVAELQF